MRKFTQQHAARIRPILRVDMKLGIILVVFSIDAIAQSLSQPPPLIRVIQTESAKPPVETPVGDTAAGIFLFGMTSLTGPAETWIVETHNSFDGLEQFDRGGRSRNA